MYLSNAVSDRQKGEYGGNYMFKSKLKAITAATAAAVITAFMPAVPQVQADSGPETKLIALTFDDGPNTTTTNEVLDLLEQYDARASFFLIGDNINAESAVSVKRAYDMDVR